MPHNPNPKLINIPHTHSVKVSTNFVNTGGTMPYNPLSLNWPSTHSVPHETDKNILSIAPQVPIKDSNSVPHVPDANSVPHETDK